MENNGLLKEGNPGRPKGATNHTTREMKEAFCEAFKQLQGDPDANLLAWGKKNTTAFYNIVSRLIPQELKANIVLEERKMIMLVQDDKCEPIGATPN